MQNKNERDCIGVKMEGGTAALYHIIAENAMGECKIRMKGTAWGVEKWRAALPPYTIL
jgi:hypothetical protein